MKILQADIILILPACYLMLPVIFLLNVVIFVYPVCVCVCKQNMLKFELLYFWLVGFFYYFVYFKIIYFTNFCIFKILILYF